MLKHLDCYINTLEMTLIAIWQRSKLKKKSSGTISVTADGNGDGEKVVDIANLNTYERSIKCLES